MKNTVSKWLGRTSNTNSNGTINDAEGTDSSSAEDEYQPSSSKRMRMASPVDTKNTGTYVNNLLCNEVVTIKFNNILSFRIKIPYNINFIIFSFYVKAFK